MGSLQRIRNRSGLLIAVIGFAMLAFIGGEFLGSLTGNSGSATKNIAEVLGEGVLNSCAHETACNCVTFVKTVDGMTKNVLASRKNQGQDEDLTKRDVSDIRKQAWSQLIRELIMEEEYEKIGVNISDEEWIERISGINAHPQITRFPNFKTKIESIDKNTGENIETLVFDGNKVTEYLQNIQEDETGDAIRDWMSFESFLLNVLKNEKYDKLIEKGTYINSEEAKISVNENMQVAMYNYINLPYSMIEDSLIDISEEEINNYYNKNKSDYKQDLSKDIDYVVFTVVPSNEDDLETRSTLTNLKDDFEDSDDYLNMIRRYSDNRNTIFNFRKKDDFSNDSVFAQLVNNNLGTVIGPYKTNSSTYRLSKLVDIQKRPDSLEARHILIQPNNTSISLDSAKSVIYDLKKKIENGADFGLLAIEKSFDENTKYKGGELGWFGEDALSSKYGFPLDIQFKDSCFSSLKNEMKVVLTQYGVHLIQVMNTSKKDNKYKIAFIDNNISASTETDNNYFTQAGQFASKLKDKNNSFDSIVLDLNLVKRSAVKVTPEKENIVGLANSRSIVRWMNEASLNEVSDILNFDNFYVVAKLVKENNEDHIQLSEIENKIKQDIRADKKYKKLVEKMGEYASLEALSEKLNVSIINNKKAQLSVLTVDGLGYSPEFVGTIFSTNIGGVSSPIKSTNSVNVVSVISKDDYRSQGDFSEEQKSMFEKIKTYSYNASYKALETDANIVDNRSVFY